MSKNLEKGVNNEPSDEDTIQCFFFTRSERTDQLSWDQLCKNLNTSIKSLSQDYLWHKDDFKVLVPINEKHCEDLPPHLASITTFGDNIEDEWFIVHIILELTKNNKDLIVQIQDNDGDFLLIEAADHLPQWANPESTENRVFIHNNHIHLIPPRLASLDEKLTLNKALQIIFKSPDETRVSTDIEKAVLDRIGKYPQKISDNTHNAFVKVPLDLAVLLKMKPSLIAPIVDAYCHHDVLDAKTFRNLSADNWITVRVKFTKCLYAMLLYAKLANNVRQTIGKDKKTSLGMKLACGFQMIMQRSSDIFSSKEYMKFINSLKQNGYFNGNLEGSKDYKIKLENAKDFFTAVECPIASNVSHDVSQLMATDEYLTTKKLIQSESCTEQEMEDNDDWLTLHPDQLNELLNSRYGKKTKFQKGDTLTPQNITSELTKFLKNTSDFEGIEPNNADDLENKIDFDPDEFMSSIKKLIGVLDLEESVDSDFSEGSMTDEETEIDIELKEKLEEAALNKSNNETIMKNMILSMKEEKASAGPSSTLMSNIGLNKMDLLDSDDDCE